MLTPTSPGVQIDTLSIDDRGDWSAKGGVANALLKSGFNINALRTNDILRKDEWEHFDQVIVEVARHRLNGVSELMSRGLTFNLPNALGSTILEWERQDDMTPAQIDMSGVTEGERDRLTFDLQTMPIPIIHKDFELNIRHLEASRKRGQSIDTMQAELCSRIVSETIENLLFQGSVDPAVLGGTIPGFETETNRLTDTHTANWDTLATGEEYLADILTEIGQLQASANAYYGPYGLFVTYATFNRMSDDFKANSDKTTISRLLAIPGLEFITPVVDLTAANSILFQLTNDVAQEVVGFQPTLVQWESMGGMKFHFKVMAIMLPRIRSTKTSQSGIVHGSP